MEDAEDSPVGCEVVGEYPSASQHLFGAGGCCFANARANEVGRSSALRWLVVVDSMNRITCTPQRDTRRGDLKMSKKTSERRRIYKKRSIAKCTRKGDRRVMFQKPACHKKQAGLCRQPWPPAFLNFLPVRAVVAMARATQISTSSSPPHPGEIIRIRVNG